MYLGTAFFIVVAVLVAFFSAGLSADSVAEDKLRADPENLPVVSMQKTRSLADTLTEIDEARVVVVGETHDRYDHHQVQLAVLRVMHAQSPEMAIGVEWFQQPFQQHLDDFVAGQIDTETLLHRTEYYDRWRYDYRLYQPILDYAREHGIRILALNASRELTRALSSDGFDDLDDDLRDQLPGDYDFSNKDYEEYLRVLYSMHGNYSSEFDAFMRVQLTWDESMAERSVAYLKENPERRLLVMAGSGHVMNDWGIPGRIERRMDVDPVTVLSTDDHLTLSKDIADYVVMSTEHMLEPTGLIGARILATEEQITIEGFSSNSAIKDVGIEKGSIIVGVDDTDVKTYAGFKLAMMNRLAGDTIKLHYLEDEDASLDERRTVEVELR